MWKRKFQKNSKKIKKFKNTITASFRGKIGRKTLRKGENKNYSKRFVPSRRVRENSKKIAKIFKKLKNTIMADFHGKIGLKGQRKIENKNYRYVSFLLDVQEKIPKK